MLKFANILKEDVSFSIKDLKRIYPKTHDHVVKTNLKILIDLWDEGKQNTVKSFLYLFQSTANRTVSYIKSRVNINSININYDDLIKSNFTFHEFPRKEQEYFPMVVYIAARRDKNDIGVLVYYNRKIEMFRDNELASNETISLVNQLIYGKGKQVRIYAMHKQSLVMQIRKTHQLPKDTYVSPDKSYAESYWDFNEDKILFTGMIDSNNISQESHVNWKTIRITPIQNFRIL